MGTLARKLISEKVKTDFCGNYLAFIASLGPADRVDCFLNFPQLVEQLNGTLALTDADRVLILRHSGQYRSFDRVAKTIKKNSLKHSTMSDTDFSEIMNSVHFEKLIPDRQLTAEVIRKLPRRNDRLLFLLGSPGLEIKSKFQILLNYHNIICHMTIGDFHAVGLPMVVEHIPASARTRFTSSRSAQDFRGVSWSVFFTLVYNNHRRKYLESDRNIDADIAEYLQQYRTMAKLNNELNELEDIALRFFGRIGR